MCKSDVGFRPWRKESCLKISKRGRDVFYRAPGDVMRDRRFGDSERLEILRAWAAEGDPGLAQQISDALGDMERRLAVSGHAAE